jgi:hypothetical protein
MNQEDIRKLLGGYATGTLTDAERKALFAAALDDQELFDELGRDQALKELLEVPGARTRLAAALTPPAAVTAWWKKPLPWALAGTLAAGLLVVFVLERTPRPTEIAVAPQLETRARVDQPAPAQPRLDQQPAKTLLAEPSAAPIAVRKQSAQQLETAQRYAAGKGVAAESPLPALQPAAPPPQALKKEEAAKTDSLGPTLADKALPAENALKDEKDARPAVQPVTQAVQSQVPSGVGGREQQLAATNSAVRGTPAAPRAAGQLFGGSVQPRLGFDYTLRRDNLIVRPLATGFLLVTALSSSGRQVVLQPAARFESGTSVNLAVPAGSVTLTVELSAQAPARDLVNSFSSNETVTVQRAAKAVSKAQVTNAKDGRVEEPPSTGRASITLAVPTD